MQEMWVVWNETDASFAVTEKERKPLFLDVFVRSYGMLEGGFSVDHPNIASETANKPQLE